MLFFSKIACYSEGYHILSKAKLKYLNLYYSLAKVSIQLEALKYLQIGFSDILVQTVQPIEYCSVERCRIR